MTSTHDCSACTCVFPSDLSSWCQRHGWMMGGEALWPPPDAPLSPHYGPLSDTYAAIRVIEEWDLNFALGNVLKYVRRAGKKDGETYAEDLRKAAWYLEREISRIKEVTS